MTVDSPKLVKTTAMQGRTAHPAQPHHQQTMAAKKARQSAKIIELKQALVDAGLVVLDQQAEVLGLSRSTTWTILKGNHKGSGLSAAVIKRILASRQLPPLVRVKVLEYVEEKAAGCYSHSSSVRRKFVNRLSAKLIERGRLEEIVLLQPDARISKIA